MPEAFLEDALTKAVLGATDSRAGSKGALGDTRLGPANCMRTAGLHTLHFSASSRIRR